MVAILEARLDKFERGLAKARGQTDRQFTAIERRGKQMESRMSELGSALTKGFLGGIASAVSIRAAQQLLDSATRIQNALKATGLSGEELTTVYGQLFDAAQRNAAPLEGLATLYSRVALAQNELGVSSQQIVTLVDNVGKAIKLSGGDAAQASGALLQLGQALGGGKVQAEEYNSLIDGLPGVLQAAAAGISEAGGSVSKLTALVKDGQVSSKAFFDGIAAGASVLDGRLSTAEETVSGGLTRLQNVLVDVATRFDDSTDASRILATFLSGPLSDAIRDVGGVFTWVAEGPIGQFISWVNAATDAAVQAAADLGSATGLDKVGGNPYIGPGRIQDRIDEAFAGSEYSTPKGPRRPTEITIDKPNSVTRPISLKDYPVIGGGGGGGGGRSSGRSGRDELQREIEQIKERTAAIQAETAAMAGINPLVNDYGLALEKARVTQDLLSAAQRAGIAVTPELRAQIEQLAGGFANASAAAEQLAESQDRAREMAEDFRDLGKDVLSGFISDLRSGKSATEALANAMNKVLDKLVEIGLNSVFENLFSGGSGGFLSALFGPSKSAFSFAPGMGLWSSGGYTGPGGKYQPAGVVHKGEYVFDQAAVRAAGGPATLDALRQSIKGYANGGYVGLSPRAAPMRPASAPQSAGTVVNIVDNAGVEKRSERRRGPDGSDIIDIVIERVKGDLAAGGFDKAMGGRFGAIPTRVTR